jgi:hypothetical protein
MYVLESDPKSDAPRPTARTRTAVVGRAGIQLSYGCRSKTMDHWFADELKLLKEDKDFQQFVQHVWTGISAISLLLGFSCSLRMSAAIICAADFMRSSVMSRYEAQIGDPKPTAAQLYTQRSQDMSKKLP